MTEPTRDIRRRRKVEHVEWAGRLPDAGGGGLDDLLLVADALPEVDWDACRTDTTLFGRPLRLPLIIGAMTGGAPEVSALNRALAEAAAATGVAMAVGSQTSALRDPALRATYSVVRETHPDGVVLANVGADASPVEARAAVEMVRADALVVHLNAAQELFMAEGERRFSGGAARIAAMVAAAGVPVVAKEVGCGIAGGTARRLVRAGVAAVDVAGRGGTDFIAVERARRGATGPTPFVAWGVPTASALLETLHAVGDAARVIASGGVRSGLDAARCLAAGASAVAVAGPLLRAVRRGGAAAAVEEIARFAEELRTAMVLCGARDLDALAGVPLVVGGRTRAWLRQRGVPTAPYARRAGPNA